MLKIVQLLLEMGTNDCVRLRAKLWNSNSNSNIVYLTSTSIQHIWQGTRDWRNYTRTVGRLKLRYRSTAITELYCIVL